MKTPPYARLLTLGVLVCVTTEYCVAQLISGHFSYGGRSREYRVYLPSQTQPEMPLVFVIHGYTESADFIRDYSQMNAVADTAGFIVVYPQAVSPGFNSGLMYYPSFPPLPLDVDDVGFHSALIDTLAARYPVDRDRIYCCGFSLGGEMTYRLLNERGSRFAAVASVAGKLNTVSAAAYQAPRQFPILHIHGTLDVYERYYEGPANLLTVPETLGFWITKNGCVEPPDTVALPDVAPSDGCTVQRITWHNGTGDAPLIFYRIDGGGHSWPGGCCDYSWANPTNRDFSASEEIWRFFLQWENPLSTMAFGQWLELEQSYANPAGDSVGMKCQIYNPEGHPVTVRATLEGATTSYRDSVTLVDDGQHGDGEAEDNIFGAVFASSSLEEEVFTVSLSVRDEFFALAQRLNTKSLFTTEGPLAPAAAGPTVDARYLPDQRYHEFYLVLENLGATGEVQTVTAVVSSTDSRFDVRVGSVEFSKPFTPGMVDTAATTCRLQYKEGFGPDSLRVSPAVFSVVISSMGHPFWAESFSFDPVTAVREHSQKVPDEFALLPSYPNPFNPTTTIEYTLPHAGYVTLRIYNVLGEEVATLADGEHAVGIFKATWDASGMPSGVYFYRLTAGGYVQTRKMVLMR